MTQIRLTKNELRIQEHKLKQLTKYLPTLQLKKAMLQTEVNTANMEISALKKEFLQKKEKIQKFAKLMTSYSMDEFYENLHVDEVHTNSENIAGVEIPLFEKVIFSETNYSLYSTPIWWDSAIAALRDLVSKKEEILVVTRKRDILQKELRDVSIRVNLFEKILIPRTQTNIKKIKVFLGDQQLAAVAQAKVAKEKILSKKHSFEVIA